MDRKVRILVVDDEPSVIQYISTVLKQQGYEAFTARNGFEGLAKAKRLKPDLITLDIIMPMMDGYEVCDRLQRDPETAHIAVLMITARGEIDHLPRDTHRFRHHFNDRLQGYDVGAVDFMSKPFSIDELVRKVRALLWSSGLIDAPETQ